MQIVHLHCSEICKCGFKRIEHDESDTTNLQSNWTAYSHTKLVQTDAFGEVQFAGSTMKARKVGLFQQNNYFYYSVVLHKI